MTSLQIKSALLFSLMLLGRRPFLRSARRTVAAPRPNLLPGPWLTTWPRDAEARARGEAAACTVAALRVLPSVDKARSEKAVGEARALFEKGAETGTGSCRHLGLLLAEGRIYLPTFRPQRTSRAAARSATTAAAVKWPASPTTRASTRRWFLARELTPRQRDVLHGAPPPTTVLVLGRGRLHGTPASTRPSAARPVRRARLHMKSALQSPGRLPPEQRPVVFAPPRSCALATRSGRSGRPLLFLVRQGLPDAPDRACASLADLYLSGRGRRQG